ncbi:MULTISPECIES: hypothetical protein [unclassified Thioalkalivibrio]|uniref:hypothetical protein n=1 Tax=unclassified Thioalkalivibrio TaxID=2621013 RepID=UPI00035DACC9|nr:MULTISPECIES: hypothetical protein [unclassified Thioalkalivibrio]
MEKLNSEQTGRLIDLLCPLVGVRGEVDGHVVELVDILDEGPGGQPGIALMDAGVDRSIQTNQYGDPLSRHSRVRTLPLLSEVEPDLHPVLRALIPAEVLQRCREELRPED